MFDHDEHNTSKDFERSLIDKNTGVLNSRGFLKGLLRYIDDSRKLNVPFSAIIRSFLNEANSKKFSNEIIDDLEAIKSVDGAPVTLFIDSVAVNSEEAKNSPEKFDKLFIARLNAK
ncbi:MAG: hypothetical protein J6328_05735 [Bacilli bacterium]|nr:hypothetical protein [Bacilli bacterium]